MRRAFPDGAVWLDGSAPFPWLVATLPAPLQDLMRAPDSYQRLAERLSRAQGLLVVRNGGAHERLRVDAAELSRRDGLRVVWIEDDDSPVPAELQLTIDGLTPASGDVEAALALVEGVLGRPIDAEGRERWRRCAAQVAGNPLALRLLAGAERMGGASPCRADDGPMPLADVVRRLQSDLPSSVRQALEVLLLSREPLPQSAALQLTDLPEPALADLLVRGWLRQTRAGDLWVPSALRRLIPRLATGTATPERTMEPWLRLIDAGLEQGLEVGFSPVALPPVAMAIFWNAALHHGALTAWLERRERIDHWARQSGRLGLLHAWTEALLGSDEARSSASSQARLQFSLALTLSDPPNLDRAVGHLEAGLRLSQDEVALQSSGYETLGTLQLQLGSYGKAAQSYRSSLELAERQGRPELWRSSLDANLAFIELLMGHTEGLEGRLRTAIEAKAAQRRVGSALPHMNALGLLHLAQERFEDAIEVLLDAQQQNARLHDQSFGVYLLHSLATAQLEQGDLLEAHRTCLRALEAAVPHVHTAVEAMIHSTRLRIAIRSAPSSVSAEEFNRHLDRYAAVPVHLRRYATLTAAMHRAEVLGDRQRAAAWLDLLLSEPLEAHLATLARRLLARTVAQDGSAPTAAAYASTVDLWPDLYLPVGVAPAPPQPRTEHG